MTPDAHVSPDDIRTLFSRAMSQMYQAEVPQYDALVDLVAETNARTLASDPKLATRLSASGELGRLNEERHGAIRVGTAAELTMLRRLFAIMGMVAVGYYDLSAAGVPVHSTAFRPVTDAALSRNPFRLFTSLLRLELLSDPGLRAEAAEILGRRRIFTSGCLDLIETAERQGGLTADQARVFVTEAVETFRWHGESPVGAEIYRRLRQAHPLVADVVCFAGPHINHLTPRTLDIDAAQALMGQRGLSPKEVVEGPPPRRVPILLRQTSFKALEEAVVFAGTDVEPSPGTHTARFGEIEQRGAALTPRGRALYDRLLAAAQAEAKATQRPFAAVLATVFKDFPDDHDDVRTSGLFYRRYILADDAKAQPGDDLETLIARGAVRVEPITYEDFLPVSAAGIFRSNLGDDSGEQFVEGAAQAAFERDLGGPVVDPDALYAQAEAASEAAIWNALRSGAPQP